MVLADDLGLEQLDKLLTDTHRANNRGTPGIKEGCVAGLPLSTEAFGVATTFGESTSSLNQTSARQRRSVWKQDSTVAARSSQLQHRESSKAMRQCWQVKEVNS